MQSNLMSDINAVMRDERLKYRKRRNAYLSLLWASFIPCTITMLASDPLAIQNDLLRVIAYGIAMLFSWFLFEESVKRWLKTMKVSHETISSLSKLTFEIQKLSEIMRASLIGDESLTILRLELIILVEAKARALRVVKETIQAHPGMKEILEKNIERRGLSARIP